MIFPDFAIVHRRDVSKRFLLEIVGFWTSDYLREKLKRLRSISDAPLILCINRALNCGDDELPKHSQIVWFQKRIDPGDTVSIAKHNYELRYSPADLGAVGPPPSDSLVEKEIFSKSLLERAGLERPKPGAKPEKAEPDRYSDIRYDLSKLDDANQIRFKHHAK